MPKITSLNTVMRRLYSFLSRRKNSIQSHRLLIEQIHPSSFISYDRIRAERGCILSIGELCQIDGSIAFERENASVSIGKRVFMNGQIIAAESVTIGDDVLISWGVTMVDHNSHSPLFSQRANDVIMWREQKKDWSHVKISPIKISDKVWIGFNSIILCGVTIGEGAIIGAGSVVTRDVPDWSVAAGNPARVIREIPLHER
jgi:galactoside O-acetyltransferase